MAGVELKYAVFDLTRISNRTRVSVDELRQAVYFRLHNTEDRMWTGLAVDIV